MKKGDIIKLDGVFLGLVVESKTYFEGSIFLTYKALTPKFIKGDIFTIQININVSIELLGNIHSNDLLRVLYS